MSVADVGIEVRLNKCSHGHGSLEPQTLCGKAWKRGSVDGTRPPAAISAAVPRLCSDRIAPGLVFVVVSSGTIAEFEHREIQTEGEREREGQRGRATASERG